MGQNFLASSQPNDSREIFSKVTDRLQQGDVYWRRQASQLTKQYEKAEDDVRELIREVQKRAYTIREKDTIECPLRHEINLLKFSSPEFSPISQYPSIYAQAEKSTLHDTDYKDDVSLSGFSRVVRHQTILLHEDPALLRKIELRRSPPAQHSSPSAPRRGNTPTHNPPAAARG